LVLIVTAYNTCPLNHGIPDGFSYVAIDWFLDRCIIVMMSLDNNGMRHGVIFCAL
jgi:hypothetical protein